jgi:hypothetical protein
MFDSISQRVQRFVDKDVLTFVTCSLTLAEECEITKRVTAVFRGLVLIRTLFNSCGDEGTGYELGSAAPKCNSFRHYIITVMNKLGNLLHNR